MEIFYETINFEDLTNEEQIIYKLIRLIYIDEHAELKSPIIKEIIISYTTTILNTLENGDHHYFATNELLSIINIIKKTSTYIDYDGHKIITIYYQNTQHALELFFINKFEEIFPKEYKTFEKEIILEDANITEDILQNLINTGIIIKNGKWLQFQ